MPRNEFFFCYSRFYLGRQEKEGFAGQKFFVFFPIVVIAGASPSLISGPCGGSRKNNGQCMSVYRNIPRLTMIGIACVMLGGCGFLNFGGGEADNGPTPASAHKVVNTARAQMGKKYISGGSSPQKGFDCSGLVWFAYRQNGIDVPRITVDQAKSGRAVSSRYARPGDIVVFRTGQSPRGLHTGVYAGKGSFIHSPGKGKKVRLENIAPYWQSKLVSIRRVVR